MTEARIVSAIINYVNSRAVAGMPLYREQVADEVDTLRLRYIDELEQANRFHSPYQSFSQNIKPVSVSKGDDEVLFVTLPRLYITRQGKPAISYIGGSDGKSPYRVMVGHQFNNAKHDMFTSQFPFAVYDEGTWRFYNCSPKEVTIRDAVFNSPRQLEPFGYDAGYDNEEGSGSDYPVPGNVADQIIGKTAETYIRTMYTKPPQPNTQSDVVTSGK